MGTDINSDAGVVGVTTLADRPMDYVLTFSALDEPVPLGQLDRITAAGAVPMITIEPWEPAGGVNQPDYRLSGIASGKHDSDLQRWSSQLRKWNHPVLVRFAHEMNGTWYPWGSKVNGNTPDDYRNAWRHVRTIFRDTGTDNAQFVWTPMAAVSTIGEFESSYPGDDDVDLLGIDGYNWGDDGTHGWASPEYVFTQSLAALGALDPSKRIIIAEVASADDPNPIRKADWITHFVDLASRAPQVDGFIWFQANKERDWRFNSHPQSANAFRAAIAGVAGT